MAKISTKMLIIIASVFITVCVTITLAVVLYRPRTSVLKIYNWEDYIDEDLIEEFEEYYRELSGDKKFKVKYDTFTDNEELLTKLETQKRDYDIAFPSEYMVEKLIKKGLVKVIDTSNEIFTDYNTTNLDSTILDKVAVYAKQDSDLYAIPYIYGTIGIMYDIAEMNADDIEKLKNANWGALWGDVGNITENTEWQAKYRGKITMKKAARDTIGTAMLYSYYSSLSSSNINDVLNMKGTYTLATARAALEKQITQMKPSYENDEGRSLFADPDNHDFAYGLYWSCDVGLVMKDNPNIEYFVPNWTNFWIDNFVLPSNGTQSDEIKRAAYEFINFMLQKENATRNMVTVGAATAIKLTTDEKYALDSTDTMFPSATILSNGGVMRDFETDLLESDVNSLMIDIINKAATIPEEKRSLLWLWIILGVIAAGGLAYLTYWLLNRQRMRNASV